jgi:hypothetical protein
MITFLHPFSPLVDAPDRSRNLGLSRCNHPSSKWYIGINMYGVLVNTCVVYWYTHVWFSVLVYTRLVWSIGIHMCGVVYWYTHVW